MKTSKAQALKLLDEVLEGTHLDDYPNHNDDGLTDAYYDGVAYKKRLGEWLEKLQRVELLIKEMPDA